MQHIQELKTQVSTLETPRAEVAEELETAQREVKAAQNAVIDGAPTKTASDATAKRDGIQSTLQVLAERLEQAKKRLKSAEHEADRQAAIQVLAGRQKAFEKRRSALMENAQAIAQAVELLPEIARELSALDLEQRQCEGEAKRLSTESEILPAYRIRSEALELIPEFYTRRAVGQLLREISERNWNNRTSAEQAERQEQEAVAA